ncbi:hypothetical protein BGP84_23805 [Pseudomonas putida]|uniref:Uncharacterized protein n=1 Tax=Pseudomonas putida TaxID=303 RepID=A0A2S3WWS6_PSEPU|nr:hypothetical protein BGP84_23805 [Pseudomonas putida]POG08624.1 hypothetical protein BGP85_17850 [Pseudomonas putida]
MGIELDVLVGHPEHDLLFVATQVARAAGLKDPSVAVRDHRKTKHGSGHGRMLEALMGDSPISRPEDHLGRCLRCNTVMFIESEVYAMLLRSRAPQTVSERALQVA